MEKRRISIQALLFDHRKARDSPVLHQGNRFRTKVQTGGATLRIDDVCFYLVRDRQKVHLVPGEKMLGWINSRRKSHASSSIAAGIQCKLFF